MSCVMNMYYGLVGVSPAAGDGRPADHADQPGGNQDPGGPA